MSEDASLVEFCVCRLLRQLPQIAAKVIGLLRLLTRSQRTINHLGPAYVASELPLLMTAKICKILNPVASGDHP
jgi:hypothetical protein